MWKNFLEKILKERKEFLGLINKYCDGFFLEEFLSDAEALLITIYLINLKYNKNFCPYKEALELFEYLGRKIKPNFVVAVHRAKKKEMDRGKN